MRTRRWTVAAAIALAVVPAGAALAYKLMPAGIPVGVAKETMQVRPSIAWNRIGARPGRFAESWTLDGLPLNDVTFYGAIPDDTALFREVSKSQKPLPRFSKTMLPPDVAQLFEASYRTAIGTSLFTIDSVEPVSFGGRPGFRFAYSFTVQNEEVRRRGEAAGTIVDGKLYLIAYEAPAIHYFDKSLTPFRDIVASAKIMAPLKRG